MEENHANSNSHISIDNRSNNNDNTYTDELEQINDNNNNNELTDVEINDVVIEKSDEKNDLEQENLTTNTSSRLDYWKELAQRLPVIKQIYSFMVLYGSLLILNPAFRWMFLMNIISGLGNFFSQIAIITLLESKVDNSTIHNSTTIHSNLSSTLSYFSPQELMNGGAFNNAIMEVSSAGTGGGEGGMSGSSISGVFICMLLPPILLMPISGMVADLFERRIILLVADIARGLLVLLFLVVQFVGVDKLQFLVYITIALTSCFSAFFEPARESLVPLVVSKEKLAASNALDAVAWMTVSFCGASAGGFVVSLFGVTTNFIFDSFSFFLSGFFCLLLFRYKHLSRDYIKKEDVEQKEIKLTSPISENSLSNELAVDNEVLLDENTTKKLPVLLVAAKRIKDYFVEFYHGIKFFIKNPLVLTSTMFKGISALHYYSSEIIMIQVVYGYFAVDDKTKGGFYYGLARALSGVTSGITPIIIERLLPKGFSVRTIRLILLIAVCLLPFTFGGYYLGVILSLKPDSRLYGYIVLIISNVFLGLSTGPLWTFSLSHLQLVCPNEYLGRAFSIDIGFLLNFAGLFAVIFYGTILMDWLSFTIDYLALFAICFSVIIAIMVGIWFIVFRNHELKTTMAVEEEKQDNTANTSEQ
ncbi:hypothetical protein ABK040_009561 [Willaertia magna]